MYIIAKSYFLMPGHIYYVLLVQASAVAIVITAYVASYILNTTDMRIVHACIAIYSAI